VASRAAGSLPRPQPPPDQPVTEVMPQVGGQGLLVRDGHPGDMLRLPPSGAGLLGDDAFTVEAYVQLDSLYSGADVRVIAGQWNGDKDQPGWALGVTSERSQLEPLTLILQLAGKAAEGRAGGFEVIASNLRLELHKVYYVAIAVDLRETGESGVTFWLKDVGDMDAPLRTAQVRHTITGAPAPAPPLVIGGRDATMPGERPDGWDGLIGELRISRRAIAPDQTLFHDGDPGEAVVGHWRFDDTPGPLKEVSNRLADLVLTSVPAGERRRDDDRAPVDPALIDLCHVLLNSNEFLYVD
jgi:hypothetical protein